MDFAESYSSFDATVVKAYADFLESNHGQSLIIGNKDTDQALDESKEDMDGMDGDYDVEDDNAGEGDGDDDELTGQNRDEEDDARVDEDGEDDDNDGENQLSDAFFFSLIYSTFPDRVSDVATILHQTTSLQCIAATSPQCVAMTSPQHVASTSPQRVATTSPQRVAIPHRNVTSPTRPNVTPTRPSVTPTRPSITPTRPNVTPTRPNVTTSVQSIGIIGDGLVPPFMVSSGAQLPDFSELPEQLLNELGMFGPKFEDMLKMDSGAAFQEQGQNSTFPWNYDGLVSDPFLSTNMTSINFGNNPAELTADHSLLDFSTAVDYESYGSTYEVPALPSAFSPQNQLLLLPPAPSDNDSSAFHGAFTLMWLSIHLSSYPLLWFSVRLDSAVFKSPPAGRGRRVPIPSLRAQRDNMIGDACKENGLPVFGGKKKPKGKRALDKVDGGPAKKLK